MARQKDFIISQMSPSIWPCCGQGQLQASLADLRSRPLDDDFPGDRLMARFVLSDDTVHQAFEQLRDHTFPAAADRAYLERWKDC